MPKLKEELQKTIRKIDDFENLKDHIEMTVTAEGLRIELMEVGSGNVFRKRQSGCRPQNGKEMLVALSQEVGKLPNKISLEGHTDAKPFARDSNYGNWELSADRANAARRLMQQNGVRRGPGGTDPRLRRPATAQRHGTGGCLQSANFADYPVHAESGRLDEREAEPGRSRRKKRKASSGHYLPTCRLLSTENTPETLFARMPAVFLSPSLSTTPSSETWPFFTMMRIGCCTPREYFCRLGNP